MSIPFTLPRDPLLHSRSMAEAAGRAILLRVLLVRESRWSRLLPLLGANPGIAATVLGLHAAASVQADPKTCAQLADLCLSLSYRMGADLRWVQRSGGGVLYNERSVRRSLAGLGRAAAQLRTEALDREMAGSAGMAMLWQPPPDSAQAEASSLIHRALETDAPLRVRLHGSPPAVVLSTPGAPALVEQTLEAYLTSFRLYEHADVTVYVVDDARDEQAAAMADVVKRLSARHPQRLVHLPEWESEGRPGLKARLRHRLARFLHREAGPAASAWVEQNFGPGLAGSANFAFWYLQGQTLVFLDQDAAPYVVRTAGRFVAPAVEGEGFSGEIEDAGLIESWEDLSQAGSASGLCVEPVDVLFLADWLLDSDPADVSVRLARAEQPTREDASYERVAGSPERPLPPVRICTFHICGHADYRARLLHHLLLVGQWPEAEAARLLQGDLPLYRVLRQPPPGVVLGRSKTAFGTAIAFSADQPVTPIPMLTTRIRLVDFSVGEILQGAGPLSVAWAPSGLAHYRAPVTGSERGRLAPYMWNDDLIWPLLAEVRRAFDAAADLPPGLPRLQAAARTLGVAARQYQFPQALSVHLFHSALVCRERLRQSGSAPWAAEYADDLDRIYGLTKVAEGCTESAWWEFHMRMQEVCRREFGRYSDQLGNWSLVAGAPPDRVLASTE